jgi:hypothetical protein
VGGGEPSRHFLVAVYTSPFGRADRLGPWARRRVVAASRLRDRLPSPVTRPECSIVSRLVSKRYAGPVSPGLVCRVRLSFRYADFIVLVDLPPDCRRSAQSRIAGFRIAKRPDGSSPIRLA